MNGTNGKQSDFPDVALVPYPVIVAATKGDPDAMKIVLQHFSGYIASLSMRKLCDERGNVYFGVDEDIRQRLQASNDFLEKAYPPLLTACSLFHRLALHRSFCKNVAHH